MSPVRPRVSDQTSSGQVLRELELELLDGRLTVAELIRERVHQEVRAHNAERALGTFDGLVQPGADERALNGQRAFRKVDAEKQAGVAFGAFERGHVLLLVDDRQVTDPAERLELTSGSTVTFLRLVPLVGG